MTTNDPDERPVLRLRPDAPDRLEALLLGAGPHLVEVLDVGSAANGDLLVVLPAPAARLVALLDAAGGLTAGEAVTVLVPLAQALQRLHDAGVTHGGVSAGAVVLDEDGSPAWSPPADPVLLRRVGPIAFDRRVEADVAAFRGFCAAMLASARLQVPAAPDLDLLAVALFGLAAAEPVRLRRPTGSPVVEPPARLVPATATAVAAAALPEEPPRPLLRRASGAAAALRSVRPRVWGALGAAVALLIAALVLLPAGDQAPAAVRPVGTSRPTPATSSAPAVVRTLGPSAAIAALVAERSRCLVRGSEDCLRRVDAPDSPVLLADLAAVRAGSEAARIDSRALRLRSATGGTALATAGDGTVLAVRDRNGWRLRDVVAEPPAEP